MSSNRNTSKTASIPNKFVGALFSGDFKTSYWTKEKTRRNIEISTLVADAGFHDGAIIPTESAPIPKKEKFYRVVKKKQKSESIQSRLDRNDMYESTSSAKNFKPKHNAGHTLQSFSVRLFFISSLFDNLSR
jgi:hypothetical protein